ncbi:type II secretion system F family protein [Aeromicrobium sp. UC242_57]|uniref:type II secretion system F family protein n=1 Tax=Aeromicrobium sp. UC242_57 TaxID=3374624 RepID=UPI0037982CAB
MGFLLLGIVLIAAAFVCAAAAMGLITVPNGAMQQRVRAFSSSVEHTARSARTSVGSESSLLARLTPVSMLERIERNMVLAGRPEGWSRGRVIVMKPVGALCGLLFAIMIVSKNDNPIWLLVGLGAIVLGYFVPDLLIYNAAIKRQEQIQKALPDTLDQIVISIEAGVGFEAALTRSAEKGTGPLADEFIRLIQDVSLGMSRREAYLALAGRTSVDELRTFARAIVQAEQYGVSIASVVRTQAPGDADLAP